MLLIGETVGSVGLATVAPDTSHGDVGHREVIS